MASVDISDIAKIVKELDDIEVCPVDEIYDVGGPVSLYDSPTATVLIRQYEQVVVKSLITSFGLDGILFHDKKGGDVDTLVTARAGIYSDKTNEEAYNNREDYDKHAKLAAHGGDARYIAASRKFSAVKKAGNLYDAYTGQKFARNANINLEHVISAKEAYDDPARVLAELSTEDLVNTTSNLVPIDETINKSKKDKSASEYLAWLNSKKEFRQNRIHELSNRSELSDKERKELYKLKQQENVDARRVMAMDRAARVGYERDLAKYYTSPKFLKSTASAALSSGAKIGVRQALGLLLTEVWCAVREEFPKIMERMRGNFELGKFLSGVIDAFKNAFRNVREKFKALIASFTDGALSGILSSITTTVINMFTVTARNIGSILRETWSSLLEAFKILFLNPDNLGWGERLRAAAKVIAVAVSVIIGGFAQTWISGLTAEIPVLGEIIPVFVGSLVSGILSVSFVYFLDNSEIIKKLTAFLKSLFTNEFQRTEEFFKNVNAKLDRYLAELAQIDYAAFTREIVLCREINARLFKVKDDRELNGVLRAVVKEQGISMPYNDLAGQRAFMLDRNTKFVI